MSVAFVGSVSVMTGGVWSLGSACGHAERVGSRGKQSAPSTTVSPSVSALKGSLPWAVSVVFEAPSPSMSTLVGLLPLVTAAPSVIPSPLLSAFQGCPCSS